MLKPNFKTHTHRCWEEKKKLKKCFPCLLSLHFFSFQKIFFLSFFIRVCKFRKSFFFLQLLSHIAREFVFEVIFKFRIETWRFDVEGHLSSKLQLEGHLFFGVEMRPTVKHSMKASNCLFTLRSFFADTVGVFVFFGFFYLPLFHRLFSRFVAMKIVFISRYLRVIEKITKNK